MSYTNKFLSSSFKTVTIDDVKSYWKFLEKNYVLFCREKRKNFVIEQATKILKKYKLALKLDEELIEQIVGQFDYPYVLIGTFDKKYLKLPAEIIHTVLKIHQRYFVTFDQTNSITNHFLFIVNNLGNNQDTVLRGHQHCIQTRLEDATFLLEQDLKLDIATLTNRLKNITFHLKLGSMLDKSVRLEKLSSKLTSILNLHNVKNNLQTAAKLSKCDLATMMVDEFGVLKGKIGAYIAKKNDFNDATCNYIKYQYEDTQHIQNHQHEFMLLSFLDSLDSLVGLFAIKTKVTSTYDRYGLRRHGIKIVNILKNLCILQNLDLRTLINFNISIYNAIQVNSQELNQRCIVFLQERHLNLLKNTYNKTLLAAVFNNMDYFYQVSNQCNNGFAAVCNQYHPHMMQAFIKNLCNWVTNNTDLVSRLCETFKRILNVLKPNKELILQKCIICQKSFSSLENMLYLDIRAHEKVFNLPVKDIVNTKVHFEQAFVTLIQISKSANHLLDNVLIYQQNKKPIVNRYNLLLLALQKFYNICDFQTLYSPAFVNK